MRSRLEDLPTFETRQATVKAHHYNLVQIALNRLGSPHRLSLPKLRTLDLHLEKEAWIVVDKSLNDIPVIAWTDFSATNRLSLHEEIPCIMRIYHSHAAILIEKIMEAMALLIGEQLEQPDTEATVLTLKKQTK